MGKFKPVNKEEFYNFVNNWPKKLDYDVTGICEPPCGTYNDFTLAPKWPDSIVAKVFLEWLGPNGENSRGDEYYEYFILEEEE